jgi:hypothetical protein
MAAPVGSDLRSTLFGWSTTSTNSADAFIGSLSASVAGVANLATLGQYAVAIGGRAFDVDTSFEPYRREAFHHRTLAAQRQSVNFTNIMGEGTVNTEGLWRREQTDWSMGAGQLLLDQKRDSQETRFRASKGLDAFSMPYQLTLQNDVTQQYASSYRNTQALRCGGYIIVIDGTEVFAITAWPISPSATPNITWGSTGVTKIYSADANDSYVYLATDQGIYYFQPTTGALTLTNTANRYAQNDTVGGGSAGSTFTGTTTYVSDMAPSYTITSVVGTPVINQLVNGIGITPNSVVVAVNGSTVTLDQPVTASGTTTTFTQSVIPSPTFTGYHLVRWVGNQVFAAAGNRLYMFSTVHTPNTVPTIATAYATQPPDLMMIHANVNWIWSDACLGASQAYISGYVWNNTTGGTFLAHLNANDGAQNYSTATVHRYGGAVYRSSLSQNATVTSFSQPYSLNYPIQALPMSPDEYPTCMYSYLNFIFLGTNKGIRMCQTLTVYDPNAQQAGDLKSGPTLPNILQPVNTPVTAITGDDRFVWFAWTNYDAVSTGIGRMDLSTFIKGDPLTPAYQSDLMVTGQGVVNSLNWDPVNNVPMFAVANLGIYTRASTYVKSGTLYTGYFDYGIPDQKIPVFFDYGVFLSSGASASATVQLDPTSTTTTQTYNVPAYLNNNYAEQERFISATNLSPNRAQQFEVALTVTGNGTSTPITHRWTLKAWPTTVAETSIMVPLKFFTVNSVNGYESGNDPYENFTYLENLRVSQAITTYQEGSLLANVIVEGLDWQPHKRRGDYKNGFEGDCVVTLKTIGGYQPYVPASTI